MIGPGWMPSRPRPMGKARRLLPPLRRTRRRSSRVAEVVEVVEASVIVEAGAGAGPFASRRARLPVATLLPRHGAALGGALQRWVEARWLWFRPRMIPLLVAFMGLVGVLNARSYLIALARYGTPALTQRTPDLPGSIHEADLPSAAPVVH